MLVLPKTSALLTPPGHLELQDCHFQGPNFKQKVLIIGPLSFMGELPESHFHSTQGQTHQCRARFAAAFVISKETVCQHRVCQPNLCQHLKHPPPVRTCLCSAATCFSCRSCSPWEGVCVTVILSMCSGLGKMFLFLAYCWFCFFQFLLIGRVHMDSGALCGIAFYLLVSGKCPEEPLKSISTMFPPHAQHLGWCSCPFDTKSRHQP